MLMTKQIIKDKKIVADTWTYINDDEALTTSDSIVSLSRWQNDKAALINNSKVGILIGFDEHIDSIKNDLDYFDMIAIEFEKFTDGRGYSYATLLRRWGFAKDIRAVGDVLRDQMFYLHRCGFTSFAVREDRDIQDALQAFNDFSVAYQPAANNLT